ncbi:amino acid adenylation domain-containing protein [Streptomyces sp. NPDC097617]|uniref:amino acid adenylation domain-containing protein n=1 Tax=Streptomyces sp. NPDC097617 TaxID=3366091 RepID=UPI00381B9872
MLAPLTTTAAPPAPTIAPTALGVVAALAQHARSRPDAVAIIDGPDELTYRRLYATSTHYAAELRRSGVQPGDFVGLWARRSPSTVVAMFGLLLAGAAFVPIDPADPAERLRSIAERGKLDAVIAPERWAGAFEAAGLRVLPAPGVPATEAPDEAAPRPVESGTETSPSTGPDGIAYVIHTSGSTGQPKGVAIPKGALDHFTRQIAAGYGLGPGDRVLQFSSIAFDGSIEEIFPPLYAGAAIVIRPEEPLSSPEAFLDWCGDLGVTLLHIPTAYWHEVVDAMVQNGVRLPVSARVVSVGGEQIRQDRVADWRRLHHDSLVRLVNVYGPTETTVVATWADLAGPRATDRAEDAPATIGHPLPGVLVQIMGAKGPAAPGEEGELHIGGPTVGARYINLPELTAERFGVGPDGVRYYHTGDRVRRLPDGSLVHLGRMDRQIKVRGFRVEPTEVEQALLTDPRVRDAVVLYDAGRAMLVGYLLAAGPAAAGPVAFGDQDLTELTTNLTDRLPAYAVPSRLVPVEAFPLNSRGKVDAEALAALPLPATGDGGATPGQQTGIGRTVASLIGDVLGIESVDPDDSVFLLGANSLTAIRILTRVERSFSVRLTLADLYANPTAAALSVLLADAEPPTGPATRPNGLLNSCEIEANDATASVSNERLPLTAFQQDAWLAEQLQPGTPMHTLGLRYRITGPVDPASVTDALRHLAERHEALRAVFEQTDDGPLMVFGGPVPHVQVDAHDLTGLPAAEREVRRGELAAARGRTVFDPAAGPLLAGTLLRLDDDEWELVAAVHHLVFDGWSATVLADDLAHLLGGSAPAPASRFSTHLREAQRAAADPARRAALHSHWTTRLEGIDTDVELPADMPRPAVRSFTGAKIEHRLDPDLLARVDEAAAQADTTTHTFVLAALQTLIARLTGHTDITVLAPVAHRDDPASERAVGAFINILPLRTDLAGDPDFRTALRRATGTVVDVLSHPDQSLAELVRALPVRGRTDRSPLTQVMLIVVNTPAAVAAHGPVTVEHLGDTFPGTTKLDLTVMLDFQPAGPVLSVEYATELFHRATAQRLLESLLTLLNGALDDPTAPISRLPLLSAERRSEVLAAGGAAQAAGATAQDISGTSGRVGVQALIEEHACRAPNAPAVTHEGRHWSYAGLDGEAERLARQLRAAGVGGSDRVGIHLGKGPLVYAAMLAVWKAGAAYVPLDPRHPAERLRHMFTDSGARALLTDDPAGFPVPDGVPVLRATGAEAGDVTEPETESTSGAVVGHPAANPAGDLAVAIRGSLDDPAYILYTSGTSGLPKGVVVSHRNLCHAVDMWREAYELKPGLSHLQAANSSFDVFVGETLRALGTGGRIVVCPHETLLDPAELYALFRAEQVNVAELVPTVLRGLLEYAEHAPGAPGPLPDLQLLAGGAEKWYVHEYRRALALVGPGGRVVNSYGVTEATVDNAYFEGDVGAEPAQAPLPIGRPYPGNHLYVLDAHGQPLPFGVPGELWIGGAGVAVGYHDRPALTEERFRRDPFSTAPGARMYRTGDGARLRADGVTEFLGRLDDQIKINGHRIELDEVEAALAAQREVRAAAAALRPDSRGVARLVGYAVPADPQRPPSAEALRRGMQEILPHYAIPAQTLLLPALPLSANGKVDRKALPQPPDHMGGIDERVLPRTRTEKELAMLWSEVLGRTSIALDDGFFELGGDSFAALRLVRLVEHRCGVRVALLDLYRNATVERLAEHIEQRTGTVTVAEGTPATTSAVGGESSLLQRFTPDIGGPAAATVVCIPYSGGHALAFEPFARALPDNWSLYALQSPGRDWSRPDESALSFDELIDRCLDEMRELPGPLYLYGHCHGSATTVELGLRAEEAGLPLAGVAIGAMFPMARLPGRFFDWVYRNFPMDRLVSDRAILEEIRALGGGMSEFDDPAEYAFAMRSVRHDERGSEDFYAQSLSAPRTRVLKAPLLSLVGSKDRVTELYTERFREWEHYADDVELAVIPKAGHGFLKHQPVELAAEVVAWADRTTDTTGSGGLPESSTTTGIAQGGAVPGGIGNPKTRRSALPPTPPASGPKPGLGRFAVVAAGQFVSTIGSALSQLVMSLWAYQQTGQVTAFAFVTAVSLLPGLLVGPFAGVVADRYDRRKVMLGSDVAAGLATLAMIGLIAGDSVNMPYVYLLCGLTSVTSAFQRPAYLAAVAQLVPKPFLGHAGGVTQLGTGAGALFAPMLGAGLLSVVSLPTILSIDAATFAVAVASLLMVRFPDRLFRRREESVRSEMLNGWRYITCRPGLKSVLWYFVVDHALYAAGFTLITPLILVDYDVSTLGVILSAGGLGALLGSLAMSVWGGTRRRTDGMLLFMAANNIGLLVIGLAGRPWLLVVGMFGMAFTESLINGHWIALLQRKVGLELQGRVLAIFLTVVTSAVPLGNLVIGPLADHVFRPMLMPGGGLTDTLGPVLGTGPGRGLALVIIASGLLLTVWTARSWLNRKLRFVEDALPDAVPDAEIEDRDTEQARADERLRRLVAGFPPTGAAADTGAAGVTARPAGTASAEAAVEEEWLKTWRSVYDASYAGSWDAMGEDFTGWDSSYDGSAIPVADMREWRDATVERILAESPRRVLEIGVGSGVFLARIAPHCERYVGTDLSPVAVATLNQQLEAHPALRQRVELHARPAHLTDDLPAGSFDTVVINSVVQYFPSDAYLTAVLTGVLRLLAPGGRVFIGDVRNLRLQECFTAGVQQRRSPAGTDATTLRVLVDRAIESENELLLDPEYFTDFANRCSEVAAVDVRTKRGVADNELTRYRYDVVLTKTPVRVVELATAPAVAWASTVATLDELAARLADAGSVLPVRVTGVPNARLLEDLSALDRLLPRVSMVRGFTGGSPAPDPEEFHRLGARLGLWTATTWSHAGDDCMDVLFAAPAANRDGAFTSLLPPPPRANRPLANTPSAPAALMVSRGVV